MNSIHRCLNYLIFDIISLNLPKIVQDQIKGSRKVQGFALMRAVFLHNVPRKLENIVGNIQTRFS